MSMERHLLADLQVPCPSPFRSIFPLDVPEILHRIIVHLTRHQIKFCVLRVCRQWNAVGRAALPSIIRWNDLMNSRTQSLVERKLLSGVDVLYLTKDSTEDSSKAYYAKELAWDRLLDTLDKLPHHQLKRTNTLHTIGYFGLKLDLYPLLALFSRITCLSIEKMGSFRISLDTVLRSCPHLMHLHIEQVQSWDRTEPTLLFYQTDEPMPVLRLRTLCLWGSSIEHTTLNQVLKKCPELSELRLVYIYFPHFVVMDCRDYFTEMASICPQLSTIHFSLEQPLTQLLFERLMMAFPDLDTWSVSSEDVTLRMYHYLHVNMATTLTTLEIVRTGRVIQEYVSQELHEFLCVAPNLLHLRAEDVCFNEESLLEFSTRNAVVGVYDPDDLDDSIPGKTIWACRRLQTLHFEFKGRRGHLEARSSPTSRKLYAYISTVCPDLRDLRVTHNYRGVHLESGLCLLSKLKELRTLRVETTKGGYFKKEDINWIGRNGVEPLWVDLHPAQCKNWEAEILMRKTSEEAETDEKIFKDLTFGSDEDSTLSSQILQAACLGNVVDLMDTLRKEGVRCWPRLESLSIVARAENMLAMNLNRQLIRKLRPETGDVPLWSPSNPV